MNTVRMYEMLKAKNFTSEEVETFVEDIISLVNQRFDDRKELLAKLLATKVDLAQTKEAIITQVGNKINRTYRSTLAWIVSTGLGAVILKIAQEYFMQ